MGTEIIVANRIKVPRGVADTIGSTSSVKQCVIIDILVELCWQETAWGQVAYCQLLTAHNYKNASSHFNCLHLKQLNALENQGKVH